MPWQDDAVSRLDDLIEVGNAISVRPVEGMAFNKKVLPEYDKFHGWSSRSLTALKEIAGPDHTYSVRFEQVTPHCYKSSIDAGIAIIDALRRDIKAGYLRKVSNIIS